jgi:hypothetical protein
MLLNAPNLRPYLCRTLEASVGFGGEANVLAGSPSWIRIEPCALRQNLRFSVFWRKSGLGLNVPRLGPAATLDHGRANRASARCTSNRASVSRLQ